MEKEKLYLSLGSEVDITELNDEFGDIEIFSDNPFEFRDNEHLFTFCASELIQEEGQLLRASKKIVNLLIESLNEVESINDDMDNGGCLLLDYLIIACKEKFKLYEELDKEDLDLLDN